MTSRAGMAAVIAAAAWLVACHGGGGAKHPVDPDDSDGDDGSADGGEQVVPQPEPEHAAPTSPMSSHPDSPTPSTSTPAPAHSGALAAVPAASLCVTHGKLSSGARAMIRDASVRAVAQGSSGDAGEIHFTYRGPTSKTSQLASGKVREQLALKLRAADGCNLVYVVWRFAPKAELVVQTKINPGAHDNKQCGTSGYTKIKPSKRSRISAPDPDSDHVLAAAIDGTSLTATIDGAVVWRGTLPAAVRSLHGPVGVRTDNVAADVDLFAAGGGEESESKCEPSQGD